jgi:hypothetical protein
LLRWRPDPLVEEMIQAQLEPILESALLNTMPRLVALI